MQVNSGVLRTNAVTATLLHLSIIQKRSVTNFGKGKECIASIVELACSDLNSVRYSLHDTGAGAGASATLHVRCSVGLFIL